MILPDLPREAPAPGLYLHIPFCYRKCAYCDFASGTDLALIPRWLRALEQEAGFYGAGWPSFETLYIGGGTPSLLSPAQLAQVLGIPARYGGLLPGAEVTVEVNPDDVTAGLLDHLIGLGVNRLSLGVQSLADAELEILERRHTAAQTLKALELCRSRAELDLSADLIFGIPGQTESSWRATLKTVLEFSPEHLSCYQLTVEPGTRLAACQESGELRFLDEEAQRRFFLLTAAFLSERGYCHYEISNYSRNTGHHCRHNVKYWQHTPYLGLGPAAHSFDGSQRWWNVRQVIPYCEALEAGRRPVAGAETLTPEQRRLEDLLLGFRMAAGVPREIIDQYPHHGPVLAELTAAGLLTISGERVLPTREGFLQADGLPLLFA